MATLPSLRTQKNVLRTALSKTLQLLPVSTIEEQSKDITARVLSLPVFQQCRSVSCYMSMPSGEVDTTSLVSEVLSLGKTLFVPKIVSKEGQMEFWKVYGSQDLNTFPSGIWGIKEPEPQWQGTNRLNVFDQNCEALDVIILPGVAFDHSLSRLGHGKGYYDRFIASYVASGRPRPFLVALALREQVLEGNTVPVGDKDWKMDMVVTPDRILRALPH